MTKKVDDREERDRERSEEARWRVAEEGAQAEEGAESEGETTGPAGPISGSKSRRLRGDAKDE
jgi:hypothetical protein